VEVRPGEKVHVRTASGELLERVAVTSIVRGADFPVIWVCRGEEWKAAKKENREPEGIAWPAEAVQVSNGKLPKTPEVQSKR
jgi:hypothetical protein